MTLDSYGYKLIQQFEGLKLKAYQDSVGIWTIGYGNITYLDGKKVEKGDVITKEEAEIMFKTTANNFAIKVRKLIDVSLTQNQFNALVSFAYNVGLRALESSTLLKLVNSSPNSLAIKEQFLKWRFAGGKEIKGLLNRRIRESEVYFS